MLNWLKTLLGSQTSGGNPHISAETIARADSLMAGGTEEVAGLNFMKGRQHAHFLDQRPRYRH